MHQHKTVAQILLILSVLSAVLATPAASVRENREVSNAMTARAPAEGVLGMRTYADQPGTLPNGPHPGLEPPIPESVPGLRVPKSVQTQSTNPPAKVYTASPQEAKNVASSPKKPSRWDGKSISPDKKLAVMYVAGVSAIATTFLWLEHTDQNNQD